MSGVILKPVLATLYGESKDLSGDVVLINYDKAMGIKRDRHLTVHIKHGVVDSIAMSSGNIVFDESFIDRYKLYQFCLENQQEMINQLKDYINSPLKK